MSQNDSFTGTDPSGALIGSAFAVQKALGPGFPVQFYRAALEVEWNILGLPFTSGIEHPVYYRNVEIGRQKIEYLVAEMAIVSVLCQPTITENEIDGLRRLLELCQLTTGLLLNFGLSAVQVRRVSIE